MNYFAEILDVFFNGRPAHAPEKKEKRGATVAEVVARGKCVVRISGKYYKITAEQIEKPKEKEERGRASK